MKTAFWTGLALSATAFAYPRLMANISDLNVNSNVSDAIVTRLYPDWRSDTVQAAQRMNFEVAAAGDGSFHFLAAGVSVAGYCAAIGFDQIATARTACRSRGTAEDGTFNYINSAFRATCGHGATVLAAGSSFDSVAELLYGATGAKESKEKTESSRRRRGCGIDVTYATDYSFTSNTIGIKQTAHGACTLFPKSKLPYLSNIWSQMGEIAFAEAGALYIQWTLYDEPSGNVFTRWHSEIDTVATDICPLYVSGSGCKF